MLDRFHYGICYYPEHHPAKQHANDIRRIADAGFDFVRLGEGAWWYWEPVEGRYQFDLFDRVIDLCRSARLNVILGTPTYAAPAWVSQRYPEVLRWDYRRTPMKHGSRRNLNYTSARFLDLSDRLCTALAAHYANEKQVVAWQLDNEFNCHMDTSYAPSDTAAFRAWLKQRYRTIERMNDSWGTRFWSQLYGDWEQIDLPHPTATYHNPSQLLDETRFISDCVVSFAARQAAILRRHNPRWRITHNGLFPNVDGPALMRTLDFFSHDQYPLFYADWRGAAAGLVTARSLSRTFAIMEQQSGPGGQMDYLHRTPRPGELRLWAFQSIAHGANALSYFCWQTCPFGSEQRWHGLIDADGHDTRRLREARALGKDLRRLPRSFFTAENVRVVGVLRDFDNETNDRRISTYNAPGQWEQYRWLGTFAKLHVPCDFVWTDHDLSGYRLIIAPHLQIVDRALAQKLAGFVNAGGVLLLGAQSGAMDRNAHMALARAPGLLATLAGLTVEDFSTLPADQHRAAVLHDGRQVAMGTYVERLNVRRGTRVVARWTGDDALLGAEPAITLRRQGRGSVMYVGGYPTPEALAMLAEETIRSASVAPLVEASEDVEALLRAGSDGAFLSVLNHSTTLQELTLRFRAPRRVLGEATIAEGGVVRLPAHGTAVFRVDSSRRRVSRSATRRKNDTAGKQR